MFAPARVGHGRRQLVISMPPTMVSLADPPPGGMGLRYKGAYQGPRWRIAVARETRPVSITDGNSIPRSVIPITPITMLLWFVKRLGDIYLHHFAGFF
jgi:hypothetical protein